MVFALVMHFKEFMLDRPTVPLPPPPPFPNPSLIYKLLFFFLFHINILQPLKKGPTFFVQFFDTMLLSRRVKRVSVSRVRYFFFPFHYQTVKPIV